MAESKTQQSILKITLDNKEALRAIGDYQEEIGKCTKAINSLKASQKELDEAQDKGKITKEEYREKTRKNTDAINAEQAAQTALKKQLSAVQYQMQKNIQQNAENNGSLKSLRGQLSQLNAQYDSLSKEQRESAKVGGALEKQIEELTKEISAAEEATGRYQRNVGHYQNALKDLGGNVNNLDKALKVSTGSLGAMKGGFEALSASPAIAIFGIIVGLVSKLWEKLKDNETTMAAVQKALNSLKPVMDFFGGILETIAEWLANIIGKVASFLGNSGLFQKIVAGIVGVGNAIVQYVISPFKGIVAAIKVFQEEGIKGFKNAAKAFGNEAKNGFMFKQNFQTGQQIGETFVQGMLDKKPRAKEAGQEIGKEMGEDMAEALNKAFHNAWIAHLKELKEWRDFKKEFEDDAAAWDEKINEMLNADWENTMEEAGETADQFLEDERRRAEEQVEMRRTAALAIGDALSDLGDLAAELGEDDESLTKISKVLALAKIAISTGVATAEGIQQAMAVPFPANIAAIATTISAIVAGMTSAVSSVKSAKFASGGYVSGAGTGTSDSIQARLSNGESVMTARATSMFAPLLSSLNQMAGGNAIEPPTSNGTEVLEQAIARGMQGARLSVSVKEIDSVRERMDLIESNANV